MRKILTMVLLLLLFSMVGLNSSYGQQAIKLVIDGVVLAGNQPPVIKGNRTLVPVRGVFEKFGAQVTWDQKTQTITATKEKTVITLKIGSETASINGKVIKLEVPAQIINNRAMVPLRFLSEAFGADVSWNGTSRTIVINTSTALFTDNLKPLQKVRLLPDEILADPGGMTEEGKPISKGSVRSADYDGGRYIVCEYGNYICLLDLKNKKLSEPIGTGRDPSIAGDYVVWNYWDSDGVIIHDTKVALYNIKTKTTLYLLMPGYKSSSVGMISPDGKKVWLIPFNKDEEVISGTPSMHALYNIETNTYSIVNSELDSPWRRTWAGDNLVYYSLENPRVVDNGKGQKFYTGSRYVVRSYDVTTGNTKNLDFQFTDDEELVFLDGSGDWITCDTDMGVHIYNLKTGEERVLFYDKEYADFPGFHIVGSFYPSIYGNWAVWMNRGDGYAYNIQDKQELRLTNNPIMIENPDDPRYHWRQCSVGGDCVLFYGGTVPFEIMKLPKA